jgi:hypothetical protein
LTDVGRIAVLAPGGKALDGAATTGLAGRRRHGKNQRPELRSVAIALVGSSVSSITKALVRVVDTLLLRQAEQASAAGAGALSQLVA